MKYFKIKIGYGESDYIPINEQELETALYIFMTDTKGVFENGVCRGKDIISIMEDWHKEMGWNPNYQIKPDDWNELKEKGVHKKYIGVIGETKERVKSLMERGRIELIGKTNKALNGG